MSNAAWTEGEWRVVERTTNGVPGYEICWSDDGECVTDHVYEKSDAQLMAASKELASEHQEWSEAFGAALMAVMQEDYGPITELAMRMPFDFHENGSPTLRSAALAKARGES